MTTLPRSRRSAGNSESRQGRNRRRLLLSVGTVTAIATAVAVAPAAQAGGVTYHRVVSQSSGLTVDVNDAAAAPGTKVIQWYDNGNTNQRWAFYQSGTPTTSGVFTYTPDLIVNKKSGLCMNSDGVAGHWLTQEVCDSRLSEVWIVSSSPYTDGHSIQNYGNHLWANVYGDSHDAGAVIDGWTGNPNGGNNETFYIY
jgi:hypothetical protein